MVHDALRLHDEFVLMTGLAERTGLSLVCPGQLTFAAYNIPQLAS